MVCTINFPIHLCQTPFTIGKDNIYVINSYDDKDKDDLTVSSITENLPKAGGILEANEKLCLLKF